VELNLVWNQNIGTKFGCIWYFLPGKDDGSDWFFLVEKYQKGHGREWSKHHEKMFESIVFNQCVIVLQCFGMAFAIIYFTQKRWPCAMDF
jgi:hypothetical protein